MSNKIYKASNGNYYVGGNIVPPLSCDLRIDGNYITIRYSASNQEVFSRTLVTTILNEAGVAYASLAAFITALDGFFSITTTSGSTAAILTAINNMPCFRDATHSSPIDGNFVRKTSSTLSCVVADGGTLFPFTVDSNTCNILGLIVTNVNAGVTTQTRYSKAVNGIAFIASANILTIYKDGAVLAAFAATDTKYEVFLAAKRDELDQTTSSIKVIEQQPDRDDYNLVSFVDTTNLAAGTNYYPSSLGLAMESRNNVSLTGELVDADGTVTVTYEVTNDEDIANAKWIPVLGFDPQYGTYVNSQSVSSSTNNFAWCFDDCYFAYIRVKVVTGGSTNTVIIKGNVKAL